ncbi:MAG TPA: ATP synthase subunit I [Casimicrobiaceae bacterium]
MTYPTLVSTLVPAFAMTLVGLVGGAIYFAALRRAVQLYVFARAGRHVLLALTLARIAGAAILLVFAAKLGALPLLAVLAGFLLARALALRTARKAS